LRASPAAASRARRQAGRPHSFQVVAQTRRVRPADEVGHGGTLAPDATGLLPAA
jgi:tRNA U55 pseudouridine synthase TruB